MTTTLKKRERASRWTAPREQEQAVETTTNLPLRYDLGIPGFRLIALWDGPLTQCVALATGGVTRADEELLAQNPETGTRERPERRSSLGEDPGSHDEYLSAGVPLVAAGVVTMAAFFAFELSLGWLALIFFAVVIVASSARIALEARRSASRSTRRAEQEDAIERARPAMVPVGAVNEFDVVSPIDGQRGIGLLALAATLDHKRSRSQCAREPDLLGEVPEVPAIASRALSLHLMQRTPGDQVNEEQAELAKVRSILAGMAPADDDPALARLRDRERVLTEAAHEPERAAREARAELEAAHARLRQLMASAEAREYLAQRGDAEAGGLST